jgi:hypothetical protein
VFLHEEYAPTTTRRGMAFADAVFDGAVKLQGVEAVRIDDLRLLGQVIDHKYGIPVTTGRLSPALAAVAVAIVVDGRMRKRARPEDQRSLAPLTIGLGPNFVAGENCHVVIETSRTGLGPSSLTAAHYHSAASRGRSAGMPASAMYTPRPRERSTLVRGSATSCAAARSSGLSATFLLLRHSTAFCAG